MLKELLLIHPLGQAAAFLFGAFNLVTGWTRKCFILPLHINLGVMYYYRMKNINADTSMRDSIAKPKKKE